MSKKSKKYVVCKPEAALIVHVGPWAYALSIAPGPLREGGRDVNIAWLEGSREIIISADCPIERRRNEAFYMVMKAWIAHTGQPHTVNEWCELSSTVLEQFTRVLSACANLDQLVPTAA